LELANRIMETQPESFRFKAVAIVGGRHDRAACSGLELASENQGNTAGILPF
jgi:hypothetical protein